MPAMAELAFISFVDGLAGGVTVKLMKLNPDLSVMSRSAGRV